MSTAGIDLALHSFSLRFHFAYRPGYDVFAFIEDARDFGFTGVNISLNGPGYRDLGGQGADHYAAVRDRLDQYGMSLEIDTSGTAPDHLRELLAVAKALGAARLRSYTRHRGTVAEMAAATAADLQAAAPLAAAAGVVIVLENHEDFSGAELAEIVRSADSPFVRSLYDYGNSMMLLEDPLEALEALLPTVAAVHLKDHVMLAPEDSADGAPWVLGVPIGQGNLPIREATRRLLAAGLERIAFENVWAYRAPLCRREGLGSATLGEGVFTYARPPFDPAFCLLEPDRLGAEDPARLLALERRALVEGLDWLRTAFAAEGLGPDRLISQR